MSPFDHTNSPAQFVFLVGAATTGLTLIIIVNQFRDRLLDKKFTLSKLSDRIRLGYLLAFLQLLLLDLILVRIFLSAFGDVPLLFDRVLVVWGVLTLGVGWTAYFVWVTGEQLKYLIRAQSKKNGLTDPFRKKKSGAG